MTAKHTTPRSAPGIPGRAALAWLLFGIVCAIQSGCAPSRSDQVVGSDPVDVVYFTTRDAHGKTHTTSRREAQRKSRPVRSPKPKVSPAFGTAASKLHPRLLQLAGAPPDSTLHLIVSFHDTVRIPVFPRADTRKSRTTAFNVAVLHAADSLIARLRTAREASYIDDTTAIRTIPGVHIRSRFWLIQALVVDAPDSAVFSIAGLPLVTNVRPVNAGEPPPNCCSGGTGPCTTGTGMYDVAAAIAKIGAGDLMAGKYGLNWFGVLDTGVFTDHLLLTSTFFSSTGLAKIYSCPDDCDATDCYTDPTACMDCPEGNPGDPCDEGHGTSTAAILVGNGGSSYASYQGLLAPALSAGRTTQPIDWFAVYDPGCAPTLNACAAVRAFEFAIHRGDPVIIAEVAADADPGVSPDPIDQAAAHAFQTNKVVIAAAGNSTGSVQGPAREPTVIGVGARYLYAWDASTNWPVQRFGKVDGRFKPEILAPTQTETAANCDVDAFRYFSDTSGATPYVGGAAAMISDWLAQTFGVADAGQTYAHIILSGSLTGPFTTESEGAGLLGLPPLSSLTWVGKSVYSGSACEYDLIPAAGVSTDVSRMDAALWWPEQLRTDGTRPHHQITIELLDAYGNSCGKSDDATNVFQRLSVAADKLGPAWVSGFVWRWTEIHILRFQIWVPYLTYSKTYRRIRITGPKPEELAGETPTVYWAVAGRR